MTRTRLWPAALAGVVYVVGAERTARAQAANGVPEGAGGTTSPGASTSAGTGWPATGAAPVYLAQATTAPEPAAQSSRAPARANTMEQVAEGAMQEIHLGGTKARYSLNYFGDTSFSVAHPATSAGGFPSFAIGVQDFLVRGELGQHIVATTEFAFEGSDDGFGIDVERMHIRWQADNFFVEAGRTHTAIGYWNNAYHHGNWLQPTIERPRWVAFEDDDGILPVHWVGIDVGAKFKAGNGSIHFIASVGNGRGKIVDDIRNTHDYQGRKAFHLSAEYLGFVLRDLRLGVAGIYDRIPGRPIEERPALLGQPIDEWIGSAYLAYPSVPLLLIVEGYLVNHRHADQEWTTYGGFGLVGYAFGPLTPYVELERIVSKGGADPFFRPLPDAPSASFDTAEFIVGLRLDLTDWTALKAEYRNTNSLDREVDAVVQEGVINWSWGF